MTARWSATPAGAQSHPDAQTETYAVTFVAARMLGLTVRCAVSVLVFERAAHVQAFLVVR